jgi:dephospho-CoA kinase
VIDADESARLVVAPGQPGLAAVVEKFGAGILSANGELDRRALRERIFADPRARLDLEAALHPLIRADMERRADESAGSYIVLAIPLLVEGGSRNHLDRIVVVDVDEAIQLERLIARDSISLDQARAILAAQASRKNRLTAADDVIENSGTVTQLRQAVDGLHERYLRLAQKFQPSTSI